MPEVINYRFKVRRALKATWTAINEVLFDGELSWARDTGELKIGDGATPWNSLPNLDRGINLARLGDVSQTGKANGLVLAWDSGLGKFTYVTGGGGGGALPLPTEALMHFDGADGSTVFTDETGKRTVTRGGAAQISMAQSKFGGASLRTNKATQDFLKFDGSLDWNFGADRFTVEFWVYKASNNANLARIFQLRDGDTYSGMGLSDDGPGGNLGLYMSSTGSSWDLVSSPALGPLALNTWIHLALVRKGSAVRLYKNGVQIGAWAIGSAVLAWNAAWQPILGGQSGATNRTLDGWFDEFRVVNGEALYLNNFTPPSAPF